MSSSIIALVSMPNGAMSVARDCRSVARRDASARSANFSASSSRFSSGSIMNFRTLAMPSMALPFRRLSSLSDLRAASTRMRTSRSLSRAARAAFIADTSVASFTTIRDASIREAFTSSKNGEKVVMRVSAVSGTSPFSCTTFASCVDS